MYNTNFRYFMELLMNLVILVITNNMRHKFWSTTGTYCTTGVCMVYSYSREYSCSMYTIIQIDIPNRELKENSTNFCISLICIQHVNLIFKEGILELEWQGTAPKTGNNIINSRKRNKCIRCRSGWHAIIYCTTLLLYPTIHTSSPLYFLVIGILKIRVMI